MNAEQGVHFLLTSFSPPPLSRCSWSLLFSALQSGTLLSIQPYADCGSREVGRGQGRWTATCLATLLKTLLFPCLHKPPSRSSPASLVRPASERSSKPERTSPERDAWKRNTKTGEIRQRARSETSLYWILYFVRAVFSSLAFLRHSMCFTVVVSEMHGTGVLRNVR